MGEALILKGVSKIFVSKIEVLKKRAFDAKRIFAFSVENVFFVESVCILGKCIYFLTSRNEPNRSLRNDAKPN